jgi:hypothetical protein
VITHTTRTASCFGFSKKAMEDGRITQRGWWKQIDAETWGLFKTGGLSSDGTLVVKRATLASVAPEIGEVGSDRCNDAPPAIIDGPRQLYPEPRRGLLALTRKLAAEFTGEYSFSLVRVEDYAAIGEVRHVCGGHLYVRLTPHSGYWLGQVEGEAPSWILWSIQDRVHSAVHRYHTEDD